MSQVPEGGDGQRTPHGRGHRHQAASRKERWNEAREAEWTWPLGLMKKSKNKRRGRKRTGEGKSCQCWWRQSSLKSFGRLCEPLGCLAKDRPFRGREYFCSPSPLGRAWAHASQFLLSLPLQSEASFSSCLLKRNVVYTDSLTHFRLISDNWILFLLTIECKELTETSQQMRFLH